MAELTFDAATHTYRFGGEVVPSVTQILGATGVSLDFAELGQMSAKVRGAIELKREIGSVLHADAHAWDDNDLDIDTVDPRVRPYLDAWITFRANSGVTPDLRERRLYHSGYRYAGTLDGIFLHNGRRVLIDIKTGDPADSGCQFQTEAYRQAYISANPGAEIHERWGVQLIPGRAIPYQIFPYTDWRDANTWQSIVTTFYAQHARRRAA